MDGSIASGLGRAILYLMIIVFIAGAAITGGISWIFSDGDTFESDLKVIHPTGWHLETNGKEVDTVYTYDIKMYERD